MGKFDRFALNMRKLDRLIEYNLKCFIDEERCVHTIINYQISRFI